MKRSREIDWLVYCNATHETGLGHLARCLGFAEVLLLDGQTVGFWGSYHSLAESMIRAVGVPFQNAIDGSHASVDELFQGCNFLPKRGLLLDSYTLSTQDFVFIRKLFMGRRIVLLDDFGDRPDYLCDAIVNFTVSAESREYPAGIATFLGPKYFPARTWLREVRQERIVERLVGEQNDLKRWLLVCGGTDFCKVTYRLVDTLAVCLPRAEVRVLLANGVDAVELKRKLSSFPKYEILEPTTELKEAFVWADACLCGGGLTKYECIFAGIPVSSFAQTPSQQADTDMLVDQGIISDLGPAYESDYELPIKAFSSCFNLQFGFALTKGYAHSIVGVEDVETTLLPFNPN